MIYILESSLEFHQLSILIGDICTAPTKVVKSLRLVLRNRSSKTFALKQSTDHKCIAKLLSQTSTLSFNNWSYWHRSRQILPLTSFPGSSDSLCRHCSTIVEHHVLQCSTKWH